MIKDRFVLKAAVLQNILKKIISYKCFKISLQIYKIIVRNKKKYIFSLFCFGNRQFAFLPSGYSYYTYVPNGYCVSNEVDYAKKNYVLPTILSTELMGQYNRFLH